MPDALHFTDAEKAAFRSTYAPTATDDQFAIFINECQRRALVPGVHVVFNLRDAKEYSRELKQVVYVKRVALITTINALRLIAERTGHYDGHGPFIYYYLQEGGDLKESKIPLGTIPHAVSVEGFRKDWKHPLFATARYNAYCQTKDDSGKKVPTLMWATRGEEQLAKCCEALMLRTVAPEECAGLLIDEELGNNTLDREEGKVEDKVTPSVLPTPITAPPVNQGASGDVAGMPPGLKLVLSPTMEDFAAIATVPVPCVVTPAPVAATVPPVEAKPQTVPESPAQATCAPEIGGLFANTTPPPPEAVVHPVPSKPVVSPSVETVKTDVPADLKTFNDLTSRAAKIVRDKLPKSGMKESEASSLVKNYLLKVSGSASIRSIGALAFEKLLAALESGTPEDSAAIVRAQK